MKPKLFAWTLLLFLGTIAGLPGQQTENDHKALLAAIKTRADAGDVQAQYYLGSAYNPYSQDGAEISVKKDANEAVKWYRKAAEQGYAPAENTLGLCYIQGKGVAKDPILAVKWLRKAAEQGMVQAQWNLSNIYWYGGDLPKDSIEAVKWCRMAANQGDAFAQQRLGFCYVTGEGGLVKDEQEAAKWYRKAADQGELFALSAIGFDYLKGTGVPRDYVEAYKWLNLAKAQGAGGIEEAMSLLEQAMTPQQIAEAQRLTRAFTSRKETPHANSNNPASPENATASGTGFFITANGYLITNNHVVKDATQVRLVTHAGLIAAQVVKVDTANDIALLKAEGTFSALPVATSRQASLGASVVTLGFPDPGLQGFAPKLAKGEIASLYGAADDARFFQISVPVQPGNSGGALVDERGNVIGIVSAKLDAAAALAASGALPENVNYAVKSSLLMSFLESVPDVSAKLKEPNTSAEKFSDVVKLANSATVMVLVY